MKLRVDKLSINIANTLGEAPSHYQPQPGTGIEGFLRNSKVHIVNVTVFFLFISAFITSFNS